MRTTGAAWLWVGGATTLGLVLGCGGLPVGGLDGAVEVVEAEVPVAAAPEVPTGKVRNVLIVVADDLGTDKVAAYGEHPAPPRTPSLDQLATEGVLFENAYGYPVGSASRAALLTGRYGRRYGLGVGLHADDTYELPLDEVLLPEMLTLAGEAWTSAALGKWDLSTPASSTALRHPLEQGFGHHAGALGNLSERGGSYERFEKSVDGELETVRTYATVDTTDDAIEQLNRLSSPWLLYVAYHAPHEPAHLPPKKLLGTEVSADAPEADLLDAAVEALDHELGRLLGAMSPKQREQTLVVFVGDNGTTRPAVRPPLDSTHGKSSLFEGGTNVPLIIRGPGVPAGQRTKALAHLVDVFPTVAEVSEVDLGRLQRGGAPLVLDGVSLWPALLAPSGVGGRRFVYTEKFRPVGPGPYDIEWRAVRDDRYKVMDVGGSKPQVFELEGRFDDGVALRPAQLTPPEQERFEDLMAELQRLKDELE